MTSFHAEPTPLPRLALLRWLTDPGADVPPDIRATLLTEMTSTQWAILAGPLNGLLLNVVALCMHAGRVFALLLAVELALLAVRVVMLVRARRNRVRGLPTPSDYYLWVAMVWCALQGALSWAGMASGIAALQILCATTVTALVGPICARNYGAPRFAATLLALCYLPLLVGAQTVGQPWLLIMVVQAPLLFVGAGVIVRRYRSLSVGALRGQATSQHLAVHDVLTGLLNRAGLAEQLQHHHATGRAFALFYLDLDGFKAVNDTFGHKAGDIVLVAVAQRLTGSVRKTDIVARLGGDEFVIVMLDASPGDAERFGAQLVRRVADQPYALETAASVRIGVSVGYACAPADGTVLDVLHRKADAALYDAKAAGKGLSLRYVEPDSREALDRHHYAIPH